MLDIIMQNITSNNKDVTYGLDGRLTDLNHAVDISFRTHSHSDMVQTLHIVDSEAAKAGLRININKTKVMRGNAISNRPISMQN